MKKWLPLFLICLITFITLTPKVGIFAFTNDDYYEAIGSYMLGNMLISGDATDLDFSEGDGDTSFLLALGEAMVTGDYTDLAQWGLNTLDDTVTNIKEFVHTSVYNVSPEIYDFLYSDDNVKIDLHSGNITKNLFVYLSENSSAPNPTPQPEPDYSFIQNDNDWIPYTSSSSVLYNIPFVSSDLKVGGLVSNGSENYVDNWFANTPKSYYSYWNPSTWNNTSFRFSNMITINLSYNDTLDRYIASYDGFNQTYILQGGTNNYGIGITDNNAEYNGEKYFRLYSRITNTYNFTPQTNFVGLSTAINYIHNHFRHYNLYVDGVLWVWSGTPTTEPISLGNNLTILNEYPAQYVYPGTVYFDMSDLIAKIKLAIQQKDVLTYTDIEDLIYDVNGNLAIGTVNFARTDYDVLASEQIPYYPKFYYDNNLNQYVQAGANMINISTEALPRDVLNILITSGVILLFGYVIRRLLE